MGNRVLITLLVLAGVAHAGPTGRVVGKVAVTEANGTPAVGAEVVVYVVGGPSEAAEPPATAPAAQIAQKDRKFVPELVAITVGESVIFPNTDPFLHNVFSQSAARPFDLGSFKKGDSKKKDFPTPGIVDVYCNIHPEMAATILVLPNRHHVEVAADGTFALDDVPAGKWQVFAYTRRSEKPASSWIVVEAGKDTQVSLSLSRVSEPEHLNKYGEKYHDTGGNYR
jgi:plastocyanin